jgi:hypothetical protein
MNASTGARVEVIDGTNGIPCLSIPKRTNSLALLAS